MVRLIMRIGDEILFMIITVNLIENFIYSFDFLACSVIKIIGYRLTRVIIRC